MAEREFIDWRKVFTFLLLISCPVPSKEDKRAYFECLTKSADPNTGLLSHAKFQKVSY